MSTKSMPMRKLVDPVTDEQDKAEALDGNALGEQPGDPGLPGVNDFTDQSAMHSEDPALLMGGSETQDEIHTREWREQPEVGESTPADTGYRLVEEATDVPTLADGEKDAVADAFRPQDGELSAEEAAIHLE